MFRTREEFQVLQEKSKGRPKIKLLYDGSCAHFSNGATQFFLSQAGFLAEFYNVHLLEPGDEPDLIWVASDKFRQDHLNFGVPIIVEDVFQGPDIFEDCRKIIKHEQVVIFLKAMMVRDHTIHNKELWNHSIHQDKIGELANLTTTRGFRTPELTEADYQKVRLSWNYIAWPHFRHGFNNDHRPLREFYLDTTIQYCYPLYELPESGSFLTCEREYDVNFIGNIHKWPDSVPLIQYHREAAFQALQECPGNNLLIDKNDIGWHEYWHKLRQSKIVVSPWGWEPVTIRDIEAVLAGCVLVKPETGFVQTYPHIPSINCKIDFSNLQEVVQMILDRWPSTEDFRKTAYNQLLSDSKTLIQRLYSIIRDALPHLQDSSG